MEGLVTPSQTQNKIDVEKDFHMASGLGNGSYAQNSSLQKKASDMVKHIALETIQQVYISLTPKSLGIADLGCSSGPNALAIIKDIIEAVQETCQKQSKPAADEFRVYLNDLPTNDFNSIFKTLPEFCKQLTKDESSGLLSPLVFVGGCPGSFYKRIVPNKSLHFVYSSYSLHWLSQVPPGVYDKDGKSKNKESIYICETSPAEVTESYVKQFEEDFFVFLQSRSEELVAGGRMVLIFLGRRSVEQVDRGNSFLWQLLTRSFALLLSKGKVEKEKLESYEVHFYAPCKEEIEDEIKREGSFRLDRLEMFEVEWGNKAGMSVGKGIARAIRAIQQSMICNHFGEGIVDDLFEIYGRLVDEEMSKEDIKPVSFIVVLTKL